MTVGQMVKRYLDENGIRYIFVARKINMRPNIFSSRINGQSEFTAEELYAVAEVLGVPLETFRPSREEIA